MWTNSKCHVTPAILSRDFDARQNRRCDMALSRLWYLQGHALFASDTSKLQKHSITIYLVNARRVVFIRVIMAALWNRAGHYIFILQFLLLSIFLLFFLA